MIDIHHHCLPGVDDGPQTFEESVEQCRMAWTEGIETIIATPHVLRGQWQNDSPDALRRLVSRLNEATRGEPEILLGSEYFFGHDVVERLDASNAIVPLAEGRYILIEFPSSTIPNLIEEVFYQLQLRRWIPIIAHPERNLVFQTKPRLLRSLIQKGAKTQVTITSLTGNFGETAREAALRWLDDEMVHFLATDAHNSDRRSPAIREGLDEARRRYGAERVEALIRGNPAAVLRSDILPYEPEPLEQTNPRGFFDVARGLLTRGKIK